MSSRSLFRVSAAAIVVSAVLHVPGYAVHPAPELAGFTTSMWVVSHLLLWAGALTGSAGVAGLAVRHRGGGALGPIGGGLAIAGLLALSGAYFYEALIVPVLASEAPALMRTFPRGEAWGTYRAAVAGAGSLLGIGFALLGIAMYRAARLPRCATVSRPRVSSAPVWDSCCRLRSLRWPSPRWEWAWSGSDTGSGRAMTHRGRRTTALGRRARRPDGAGLDPTRPLDFRA